VVKAVSEIVEATKVINGDLESYVRLVVSGSTPIRRQPMPVTLVETLAPTPGAALHWATPEQVVWIGRFFFIWISVFNLFVVSIFWSMVVDIFNSEQGKRLFGFIAAGATLGAIVGSSVTASLAQLVQPAFLLVGAAILLEVSTFCVRRLSRLSEKMSDRPHPEREEEPIGGGVMAGFVDAVRSPYLLNTAIFLLLYAVTSTFLYFSQASVVSESFTSRGAQTAFFAAIDLTVNVDHASRADFLYGAPGALARCCGGAGIASGAEHAGLWSDRSGSDLGGGRVVPGASPCRQLCAQSARAPGLVHGRVPGRPLQGEEFHRYRGVPGRRPGGSLVLCAGWFYWLGDQGSRHHRYCAFGAMAREQPLARQTTGGLGRTAGAYRAEQC
jgi:hypothetical protein